MKNPRKFPDWDTLYKETPVPKLPWYSKRLEPDLVKEIKTRNMKKGRFLDLGTGQGTQAAALAKLGFDVTGTDISRRAIELAQETSQKVTFHVDNILNTRLSDKRFDYILDRGCFHVLPVDKRNKYVKTVKRILDDNGILFLKCFSIKEQDFIDGPYRFSQEEIKEIFGKYFVIESLQETEFYGTLKPRPKALFIVMRKR